MLNKDIFEFLEELKNNNNREWFASNKKRYESVRTGFELTVAQMIESLSFFDKEMAYLTPKNCIFRIYRDVRFSLDKSPYKTHFGAVFRPKKLAKTSGYYLHISPEDSFISCGHYMLQPDELKKIRRGIYNDFEMFSEIINKKGFKEEFGDLYQDDDKLSRVPNGFDKNHPAAEYLKLKHFYVVKQIPHEVIFSEDLVSYAVEKYKKMKPLSDFLNDLLTE